MSDIESEKNSLLMTVFCYREIKDMEDTLKHQKDIDRLGIWARKWGNFKNTNVKQINLHVIPLF